MQFTLCRPNSVAQSIDLTIEALIVAGWTGRDHEAMEKHIVELEALGIKRPKTLPVFYRCSASCITQADKIQVPGTASSGEVEFIFYRGGDETLYLGVGSDHTEREVEAVGVTISKQMCDKPVSSTLWAWEDVADHWDKIILRSYAVIDGERVLYQEGAVTAMIDPMALIERYDREIQEGKNAGALGTNTAIFGGTFAAIGGVRPGDRFEMQMEDPVLGRVLTHAYDIEALPVEG